MEKPGPQPKRSASQAVMHPTDAPQPDTLIVRFSNRPEVAISVGAIIGTTLRFLVTAASGQAVPTTFPTGTLLVNLLGSALIGVAHALLAGSRAMPSAVSLLVSVGLLGGFTTFSTFSLETVLLIEAGRVTDGLIYQGLSLAGAIPSVWIGLLLGGRFRRLVEWRRRG